MSPDGQSPARGEPLGGARVLEGLRHLLGLTKLESGNSKTGTQPSESQSLPLVLDPSQDPGQRTSPPGAYLTSTRAFPCGGVVPIWGGTPVLAWAEPLLVSYHPHQARSPSRSSLVCLGTSDI